MRQHTELCSPSWIWQPRWRAAKCRRALGRPTWLNRSNRYSIWCNELVNPTEVPCQNLSSEEPLGHSKLHSCIPLKEKQRASRNRMYLLAQGLVTVCVPHMFLWMAQHQNLVIQFPRVLVQCAIDTTTNGTFDLASLQIMTRDWTWLEKQDGINNSAWFGNGSS